MRAQLEELQGIAGVTSVGIPPFLRKRFVAVLDGIDTDFFSRGSPAWGPSEDPPLIFLPARVTPAKGQADLIKVAGILKNKGLKFRVVFAGRTDSGEYLEQLQTAIRSTGVSREVEFVGQLDGAGLRSWYSRATILAFPTYHHEGLPRILLEAQAMEVPPVVYASGGSESGLIDGESGFLVKTGSLEHFVRRIEELLRSPVLCRDMGLAGRKLVQHRFSLAALAARHEEFYLGAIRAAGVVSCR